MASTGIGEAHGGVLWSIGDNWVGGDSAQGPIDDRLSQHNRCIQPTDARGKEPRALPRYRSCGRYRAVLYNQRRPHYRRWCFGKTPMQTFRDALPLAKETLNAA